MRLDTTGVRDATLTSAVLATPLGSAPPLEVPGSLRRIGGFVGDLLALGGIILCLPFVILAIAIPIALCVRLLLWITGLI